MRGFLHLIIVALLILGVSSCREDANNLTLPSDLDKDFSLVFVDTLKVDASTVLLDSLPTSNNGTLLLGKYYDDEFGWVEATPYMEFTLGGSQWIPNRNTATFSSFELKMKYSGYYYGDTLATQTFHLHEVDADFVSYRLSNFWMNEFSYPTYNFLSAFLFAYPSQYNNSSVRVEDSPLATFSVKPQPLRLNLFNSTLHHEEIAIRLPNSVGEAWLEEAKKPNSAFTDESRFRAFFKGLAIKNDPSNNGAIFGVPTDSLPGLSNIRLQLIYKEGADVVIARQFPMVLNANSFTNIKSDRSSIPNLNQLTTTNPVLSSAETEGKTYVQSGVGIFTKLTFPTIKNIYNLPGFLKLNSANLIIEPAENSFTNKSYLPRSLILFQTDNRNMPLQPLPADYNPRADQLASVEITNIETHIRPVYRFSVTQYIEGLLNRSGEPKDVGLLVSTGSDQLAKSVNRIILGAGETDYRVRLEIYYLRRTE